MFIHQQVKGLYRRPLPSLLQLSISRCTHFCALFVPGRGANSFQSQSSVAACKCLVSRGRVTNKICGWWLNLDPQNDSFFSWKIWTSCQNHEPPKAGICIAAWPHPISPFFLVPSFPIGVTCRFPPCWHRRWSSWSFPGSPSRWSSWFTKLPINKFIYDRLQTDEFNRKRSAKTNAQRNQIKTFL